MTDTATLEATTHSFDLEGQEITFETGKIARQANGAVMVKCGETVVFASACSSKEPLADVDFLPLRIDYQEKFSSAGKTLGGFIKREGRPTQKEILTCRLIDRPLRPLFPEGFFYEVQLLSYVWSFDGVHSTDVLAITAASAALMISDISYNKALGAVRVGMIDGQFVINPTIEQQEKSSLDLVLAGTHDAILMIEGYCDFLTEEQIIDAISQGHNAIQKICAAIEEFTKIAGKEKNPLPPATYDPQVYTALEEKFSAEIKEALSIANKKEREVAFSAVKEKVVETFVSEEEDSVFTAFAVAAAYKKLRSNVMRDKVLTDRVRIDGRAPDEIRPIFVEQSPLPRTHGSSLFTRGETQALAVCTLGGETMAQRYESLVEQSSHRFYLQYSFPPFSVGEVGRVGSPGRREIGHGKLAERALSWTLPDQETFPYVIRLESNITESNGSSSMASVCGGCLALMEAGVPIKSPVSGIAMGLILKEDQYCILSDIIGAEDALGDMDFKITGNKDGVTAFQMDIKVEGITIQIMKDALEQAKKGRIHILDKMTAVIPEAKKTMAAHAPKIAVVHIKTDKIAAVIGPGGKQIRAIIEESGAEVDINDDGVIQVFAADQASLDKAKEMIHNITAEMEKGKTYEGTIVSIVNFGMFVKVFNQEGLCHISEVGFERYESLEGHFKVGEKVNVKVLDINDRGQIKLSRKATLEKPNKEEKPATK